MQLVFEDKEKREIKNQEKINFFSFSSYHLIAITARAKSEKQLGKNATDDEDLTIKIDDKTFPKLNSDRLKDSPSAFSGGQLHDLAKTIYFLTRLEGRKHTITLTADDPPGTATLEEVKIYTLSLNDKLSLPINKRAEDGDRRPWITFVLDELPLDTFGITARTDKRYRDSDDLKIIIDGKTQTHFDPEIEAPSDPWPKQWFYRFWYFVGSLLQDQVRIALFFTRLSKGRHYIELHADRKPKVEKVEFDFGEREETSPSLKTYAKGQHGEDYNRFDKEIKQAVEHWNDFFLVQKYPPPKPLDPNLVKAMIYIESRIGYYQAPKRYYPAYPDVMQVADPRNPAIHTLNNDGWIDPNTGEVAREYEWKDGKGVEGEVLDYHGEANGNTPEESIKWGVRWLYHKAQFITSDGKRGWRSWNKAVQNYNTADNVKYEREVYDIYLKGVDRRNPKRPIKLWTIILTLLVSSLLIGGSSLFKIKESTSNQKQAEQVLSASIDKKTQSEIFLEVKDLMREKLKVYKTEKLYYYGDLFKEPFNLCKKHNECYPELIFTPYISDLAAEATTYEQFAQAAGSLKIINSNNFASGDFDNDGRNEMAIVLPDYLNRDYTTLVIIDNKQDKLQLYKRDIELGYFSSPISEIGYEGPLRIEDVTGDATPEILLFLSSGRWGARLYIFTYSQGKIYKLFAIDDAYIYPEFTFTDQNNNHISEIHVTGEKFGLIPFNFECNTCQHMQVQESFEYNPGKQIFEQIRQEYLDIPGAFYYFLEEVKQLGFEHRVFEQWSESEKKRFTYTLNQLRVEGANSLFDTVPQQYISGKGKSKITLHLRRPIRLADIIVREDETKAEEEKRLSYYHNSPLYEAKFKKAIDGWKTVSFTEFTPKLIQ